ncbi:RHS repeat-associated protein [Flavobacterium sp. 28YEA47A]|uniref:DUF6443 domain-containing protein n=1 Tax=Flavobacterium sp. 28YEA47A TaxID=3156276 RepID=UPI00351335D8
MKKILSIAILLFSVLAWAQQTSHVKTTVYKTETSTSIAEPTAAQASQTITYFDNLARPIQQRSFKQSASGRDIVTHLEYDASGKQLKGYMPYVSNSATLQYDSGAKSEVLSFYGSPSPQRTGNPNFEASENPYNENQFEASPLGRVTKKGAPGNSWKLPLTLTDPDHTIKLEYYSNTVNDNVKLYKAILGPISNGYFPATLTQEGEYEAGKLYKTITKTENWTSGNNHTMQEFKNNRGQLLLKRVWGNSFSGGVQVEGWHETYYVYDQFGNLTFVLPPMSDGTGSQADLDGLCYQYRYDDQNRLVEKKEPGKNWEFIIYNSLNRVIATGPAFSPFVDIAEPNNIGWLFTKYDIVGRPVYTGWMQANVNSDERNTLQNARDMQITNLYESKIKTATNTTVNGVSFRYTNQAWPTGMTWHVLTVNYYDDYNFPEGPSSFSNVEGQAVFYNQTVKPIGLSTGRWTRVLEAATAVAGELAYTLYDSKARPIRTWKSNHLGGFTQMDAKLDFSGNTLYTLLSHKRSPNDNQIVIREDFTYSDQGRMLSHTHKIGSKSTELISLNTYDELGKLISKRVGGTDLTGNEALQKIDYTYNIRGWLKEINKVASLAQTGEPTDLFAFKINYEAPQSASSQLNGNISETYWRTGSDNILRRHTYQFDGMGRLISTSYHKPESVSAPDSYKESQQYDKNGNIRKLQRYGEFDDAITALMIDDLDYAYQPNSNRISKITDHTNSHAGFSDDSNGTNDNEDDYDYDINGNLKYDQNKRISKIIYNHFNQPLKIIFMSGATIEYIYNARGEKLKKTVNENPRPVKVQEYFGNFDYANGVLEVIITAGGYVKYTPPGGSRSATFNYVYNYTDHLGNIRLSYTKDPYTQQVVIMEENNYYPLGLSHKNYNMTKRVYDRIGGGLIEWCPTCPIPYLYNYKFNGQELQDELGLNMFDMPARDYDPAIGRWTGIDPVTHYDKSPYNGHDNNPIYWQDSSGADAQQTSAAWSFNGVDIAGIYNAILSLLNTGTASYTVQGEYSYASGPDAQFISIDGAALDFAVMYNGVSIINKVELGSAIYSIGGYYSYTIPTGSLYKYKNGQVNGTTYGIDFGMADVPAGAELSGFVHTHANYENPDDNNFSSFDKGPASNGVMFRGNKVKVPVYVVTPSGELMVRDVYHGEAGPKMRPSNVNIGNQLIPNDPKSPVRIRNYNVSPNVIPPCAPTIWGINGYPIDVKYKY